MLFLGFFAVVASLALLVTNVVVIKRRRYRFLTVEVAVSLIVLGLLLDIKWLTFGSIVVLALLVIREFYKNFVFDGLYRHVSEKAWRDPRRGIGGNYWGAP